MNWYYEKNEEPHGPISLEELLPLVSAETLVWKVDSLEDWVSAKEHPDLIPFYSEINIDQKKEYLKPPTSTKGNLNKIDELKAKEGKVEEVNNSVLDKFQIAEINLERKKFKMKYYSNWKLDASDPDFNIDRYFSIDPPSSKGTIIFVLYKTSINEKGAVDEAIEEIRELYMEDATVSNFKNWGKYKGQGSVLSGFITTDNGEKEEAEYRVFAHSDYKCSFLIASSILKKFEQLDLPGLKLIESTFEIKT